MSEGDGEGEEEEDEEEGEESEEEEPEEHEDLRAGNFPHIVGLGYVTRPLPIHHSGTSGGFHAPYDTTYC